MEKINLICSHPLSFFLLPCSRKICHKILKIMFNTLREKEFIINKIEVFFITDYLSAILNKKHMHRFGPTNILTFPGDKQLTGSLMLSLDTYYRECKIYSQNRFEYFIDLLAHGFAHLPELDHGRVHSSLSDCCANAVKNRIIFIK